MVNMQILPRAKHVNMLDINPILVEKGHLLNIKIEMLLNQS